MTRNVALCAVLTLSLAGPSLAGTRSPAAIAAERIEKVRAAVDAAAAREAAAAQAKAEAEADAAPAPAPPVAASRPGVPTPLRIQPPDASAPERPASEVAREFLARAEVNYQRKSYARAISDADMAAETLWRAADPRKGDE